MSDIQTRIRISQRLIDYDLIAVRDFCRDTDGLFRKRIESLTKKVRAARREMPEEEQQMWTDSVYDLEGVRSLGGYFGVLMVFASLERYFLRLYEDTVFVSSKPELRDIMYESRERRLTFDDAKRFLKLLGIKEKAKVDWGALNKLHRMRNAIVHQGGMVDDSNIDSLRPYGYKVGHTLQVPVTEVLALIRLAREATEMLSAAYLDAMKLRGVV